MKFSLYSIKIIVCAALFLTINGLMPSLCHGMEEKRTKTKPSREIQKVKVPSLRFLTVKKTAEAFLNKEVSVYDLTQLPIELYDYIFLLLNSNFDTTEALKRAIREPHTFSIDIIKDLLDAGADVNATFYICR